MSFKHFAVTRFASYYRKQAIMIAVKEFANVKLQRNESKTINTTTSVSARWH